MNDVVEGVVMKIDEQFYRLKAQELYGKDYVDLSDSECATVSKAVANDFNWENQK